MTPAIMRAAQDARYVLMVRKQYSEASREAMFNAVIKQLTHALQEYTDSLPAKPKTNDFAKFDEGLGSYLDLTEWSGQ